MNWFSESSWLWKALHGRSVTAAALFALSLFGLSVIRVFRHLLAAAGVPWYLLLILPIVAVGAIARREEQWMPDAEHRKRWSRRLVFGAIGLSLLLACLTPKSPSSRSEERPPDAAVRIHGPSGK